MANVKLTDVCSVQYGYPFDSKQFSASEGMPLIRIRDVVRGYSETYTTEQFDDEYIVRQGDMLVGMDGEFNIAKWGETPALLNQRVCRIIPSDSVHGDYIFYAMPKALKEIENRTAFVTVKHLSAKEINKIVIPLPPLETQKQIAATLDKATHTIDLCNVILEKLDLLVKARFVEMFGELEEKVTVEDVCSIITDGTHQPPKFIANGIPFLFVSNIVTNEITYNAEKYISEETYLELYKRTPIEIGDIVLSTVGSYGHPAIVKTNDKFLFQRHIAYLKPIANRINSIYLHSAILSCDVQRQIEERVKGVAQKTLNLSEIRKLYIPLPPLEQQNQFAAFVEKTDRTKAAVKQVLAKAETLKKALMQEYFG